MLPGRGPASLWSHPGPGVTKLFSLSHPVTNTIRQAASDTERPVPCLRFCSTTDRALDWSHLGEVPSPVGACLSLNLEGDDDI